jgi:glutamate/tyrosine decarboxylase-like PLP-dependent enzyme
VSDDPTRAGDGRRPVAEAPFGAWFAGPKGENGEEFGHTVRRILDDHHYWRRNYFPEDGVVLTSELRRRHGAWNDRFEDKLLELLAALKADYPFHSPRYAAHMLSEQTLPAIAGYFAGMLYNPNNVTKEAAPVTVRLELEAGRLLAAMLGHDPATSWAHLTSGGTVANLEALWAARTVRYLPLLLQDLAHRLDLEHRLRRLGRDELLGLPPALALEAMLELFDAADRRFGSGAGTLRRVIDAWQESPWNVMQVGVAGICAALGSEPVVVLPESYHYCFPKSIDVLGLGRRALLPVPVDERFRMDVEALERELADLDRRDDRHVLAVVAVVGSTEEGSVDPVHRIAALRDEREARRLSSFWLHADAAYGGYLRTTLLPERRGLGEPWADLEVDGNRMRVALDLPEGDVCDALTRLGDCDSIVIDPHKLGYVPYPAGAVCFRSHLVRPVLRQTAPYLDEAPAGAREESTAESVGVYVLEGSKPGAAAAAVWLAHTTIPLDTTGHGALVRETVRNACELHALLERWPELDGDSGEDARPVRAVTLCPPDSNIVCYAFRPVEAGSSLAALNRLNRAVYRELSLPEERRRHVYDQRFFVSRSTLHVGQYGVAAVAGMLDRLGVSADEYREHGLFLLRSTLMSPWYGLAKGQGRFYLADLVRELYDQAGRALAG